MTLALWNIVEVDASAVHAGKLPRGRPAARQTLTLALRMLQEIARGGHGGRASAVDTERLGEAMPGREADLDASVPWRLLEETKWTNGIARS